MSMKVFTADTLVFERDKFYQSTDHVRRQQYSLAGQVTANRAGNLLIRSQPSDQSKWANTLLFASYVALTSARPAVRIEHLNYLDIVPTVMNARWAVENQIVTKRGVRQIGEAFSRVTILGPEVDHSEQLIVGLATTELVNLQFN